MILCGPFGQGGFALQILGGAVQKSFPAYARGTLLNAQAAGPIAAVSQFAGVLSWGFATFWWCFAIISILHTLAVQPGGFKCTTFSLGAWSLVFPWVCPFSLLWKDY
jgi:sodium-dependent phosphate transporter